MVSLKGWRYLFDYRGQHPGYAELDDFVHPVDVRIYGCGNKRKALSKATGKVEFEYEYMPLGLLKGYRSGNKNER